MQHPFRFLYLFTCLGRRGWMHCAPPPSLGGADWGAAGWGGVAPRMPCLPRCHTPSDPLSAWWLDAGWPPGSAEHHVDSGVLDSAHSPEEANRGREEMWCKQTCACSHIQQKQMMMIPRKSCIHFHFRSGLVSTNSNSQKYLALWLIDILMSSSDRR